MRALDEYRGPIIAALVAGAAYALATGVALDRPFWPSMARGAVFAVVMAILFSIRNRKARQIFERWQSRKREHERGREQRDHESEQRESDPR